jgi:hypothetical protein
MYGKEAKEDNNKEEQACECAEGQDAEKEEEAEEEEAGEEAKGEEENAANDEAKNDANEGAEANEGGRRAQECECASVSSSGAYQIGYDVLGDIEQSCSAIQSALRVNPDTFTTADMEKVVTRWSNVKNGGQPNNKKSATGWIIAAVVVCVVAIVAFIVIRRNKARASTDTKRQPLVYRSKKIHREEQKPKKESIEIYFQNDNMGRRS